MPPTDKKLEKLQKIFDIANEDVATPTDLIKLSDALLAIITHDRERLDTYLADDKTTDAQEKADIVATVTTTLNEKEAKLKYLISELGRTFSASGDQMSAKFSKEVVRLEKKIPSKVDLSDITNELEGLKAGINSFPSEITRNNLAVRDGLELLEGDERLDKSAVKGLEEWYTELLTLASKKNIVAGSRLLRYMADVAIDTITNGQTLIWNATLGRFEPGSAGSGSGHVIQDEGISLTNRGKLNFVGTGVTVTDGGAGLDSTIVTIAGGGGSGDVVGPASSVNSNVALFNGITGKLIKDSGLALSGTNTGDKTTYITVGTTKADYITDGTADDVEINQAVQAAIAAGGGTVLIKAGTYNLAATIALNGNNITLLGTGEGTLLKTANASNVNPITVSGTGRINVKVKMMKIDCNRANNTFGDGIVFNTPWSATDPNHVLEDLYIVNCKNNGIEFTASSDTRVPLFRNIHIQDCDGNGLYMPNPSSTDGIFENIIVDRTGLNGLFIGGANHHFTNCKTFYCGSIAGNNHGFYINGYNNYFTNCEAQDNYQSGFYLDATGDITYGARGNTFTNCIADSNGQALNAAYSSGWQIVNTPDTQIIGGVAMTRPYPSFTQLHGVRMTGTTTRTNVVGMWFSANTNPWTDASSGTNYRSLCTGQTTEASTVPGAITMGQNALNLGSSTGKIYGSGARIVIDGASQTLQLDNLAEIFYNFATPVIQMFNAAARTLIIKNDGGGAANLQVTNDIKSRTNTLIGATSGQTSIVPAAVASGTQTMPSGTGTLLSSATNLAANPVTGTPSSTNFLRGDGTWATPAGTGDMILASPQTNSGLKTFMDATLGLRNVANTITSVFTNAATVARTWTLKDADGTIAFTSDITGVNSGTNTGDNATNTQYSGLVTNATHTGDATGATILTLATVNANVGSFTNASVTVNAKGLITAVATGAGGSGITRVVASIAVNTTAPAVALTDYVYLVSGTTTLTLPTAVGNTNQYTVKRTGTNTVTIATTSAQTIDGSTTAPLTVRYQSLDLVSDGSNWNVL